MLLTQRLTRGPQESNAAADLHLGAYRAPLSQDSKDCASAPGQANGGENFFPQMVEREFIRKKN